MFSLPFALLSLASAREIALYWGQADAKPLIDYCAEDAADIFILAFVDDFGAGRPDDFNLSEEGGKYYGGSIAGGAGDAFLNDLSGQIQWCQNKGKKVLVSLGGSDGNYGFSSAGDASGFANYLWDAFLGGSGTQRPFNSAKLDGIDLDIEKTSGDSPALYVDFVNELRNLYATDSSKQYYISSAPQPPLDQDQFLGKVINDAWMDYLFVQFYNNDPFNLGDQYFLNGWESYTNVRHTWKNPNAKIFVGLPGESSAGDGYVPIEKIKGDLGSGILNSPAFGGFMVWEAGEENTVNGEDYSKALRSLL